MRIGELSKLSGYSIDTLRYYHKIEIFDGLVVKGENGYREFKKDALEVLQLISDSKTYGFTLKESKALLKVRHDPQEKLNMIENFLLERQQKNEAEIQRLMALNKNLAQLRQEIDHCRAHCVQNSEK